MTDATKDRGNDRVGMLVVMVMVGVIVVMAMMVVVVKVSYGQQRL